MLAFLWDAGPAAGPRGDSLANLAALTDQARFPPQSSSLCSAFTGLVLVLAVLAVVVGSSGSNSLAKGGENEWQ